MGDALPGLQARLMSQALHELTASIDESDTMVIFFIDQIRMKIGVMYGFAGNHHRRRRAETPRFRPPSTSAASARSRSATMGSGDATASRWSRTSSRPRSRQSRASTSCMAEGVLPDVGEILDLGVKAGIVEDPRRVVLL